MVLLSLTGRGQRGFLRLHLSNWGFLDWWRFYLRFSNRGILGFKLRFVELIHRASHVTFQLSVQLHLLAPHLVFNLPHDIVCRFHLRYRLDRLARRLLGRMRANDVRALPLKHQHLRANTHMDEECIAVRQHLNKSRLGFVLLQVLHTAYRLTHEFEGKHLVIL